MTEPLYEGGPIQSVPLMYPFRIGRRRFATMTLHPPTYRDLQFLQASPVLSAEIVLARMCDWTEDEILSMRWPDIDVAMETALGMLPQAFSDAIRSAATASAEPSPAVPASLEPPGQGDPGDSLGDFMTSTDDFEAI